MKFTLKDYQWEAFEDVVARLDQGRTVYRRDGKPSSFALTATTGAGKTVMAAAAIETLFFGNDALNAEADPGAVVIWFSDDPSLNDQTRSRLMQASEKLISPDLITIAPPFSQPRLQPRKVYFLNTGKLTKSSLLTRGHVEDPTVDALPGLDAQTQPDMQGWTIWQTIANTIDADDLTVYLVLDEAHRGFGARTSSDKPTIVRRLVNGHAGYPPIPVVWGISATIENFQKVMDAAAADDSRRKLSPVQVAPSRVQESGLVKDVVSLDIPAERGNFDSVLVRRAARLLRESTQRWRDYGRSQGTDDIVRPLLVLQAPNKPDPDEIGIALDTIIGEYPELGSDSVRHVLGDHTKQRFGSWEVEHIEPPRVEETTKVRVLIAKDGISTGWDCPRAEVLVSFRPATEPTHITQLLGRMVRNPLARRVPGDERLNAVDCILPFFDRTTAVNVVKYLTGQIDGMPAGSAPKVLQDGRELRVNPSIPEAVWGCWDELPTMTMPQRGARPTTRLVALAERLSADGVRPGAVKEVHEELHSVLDGYALRYHKLLEEAVAEVWAVRGQTIAGKVGRTGLAYTDFVERADDRAIRTEFEKARKAFGADVALSYVNHLAGTDDEDDDLVEAYVKTSALATVLEVRVKVDQEASELADRWFTEHRVAIRELPDLRRGEYDTVRAQTTEPRLDELRRPRTQMEDYAPLDKDTGVSVPSPLLRRHLMSDTDGMFPIASLNDWERTVVAREVSRPDCVGWYRNPSRAAVDSLGISYRDTEGNWRSMHPDFIFFNEIDGEVTASLVDPHGHHLDDAKSKLAGFARFARDHGAAFHRIQSVSKIGNTMKVLDLQLEPVREALLRGNDTPIELYKSDLAVEYDAAGHGG